MGKTNAETTQEGIDVDPVGSRAPWWRRPWLWIGTAAAVGLVAGAAWILSTGNSPSTTGTVASLKYAEVQRTTLEDVITLDGTLGFVAGDPLVYAGSPDGITTLVAGASGTVTSLPDEGSTVNEGGILYTKDEQPVVVFYGAVPAYRTLDSRSSDGDDVLQLEEALTRLGYDEDGNLTVDGDFTYRTRDAIKALQDDLGIDDTGALVMGSYVFVDGPLFIADTLLDVGSPISPGMAVIATSTTPGGTVTATAAEGDVLGHGDTLFVAEGSPVTLFVTDVPFYRTLDVGSEGDDVRVLESALSDFGFDAGGALTVDGVFDEATVEALVAWQESTGAPQDGVLNIGEIMVSDAPIRLAVSHITIGSTVGPGTMIFTPSTSTTVVSVELPAEDQDLLVVGDSVIVVMPNGDREPAVVTAVGAIAIRNPESGTYFEVEVTLDSQSAAAGLDEAPVEVDVVDSRAENILAVPVTALLALAEGGYAVEIDAGDGTTRLVAVEVGMYADGSVEVSASELEAGVRVVIP